jgi:hypothetical protein
MNEDYLWDKTGEPDPEIEELERVLGTLRYQPRTFEVPRESQTGNRRTRVSLLAIAATIAIAVVAAGIWLALNRPMRDEIAAIQLPEEPPPTILQWLDTESNGAIPVVRIYRKPIVRSRESMERLMAERKEAEVAKQQLLLALRLTSSKLSMAQKKVQGTTPGIIRNQHKVG